MAKKTNKTTTKTPYGETVEITNKIPAECWNFTDGAIWEIPQNTKVKISNIHDAFHTSVMLERCTTTKVDTAYTLAPYLENEINGKVQRGYKFIINNKVLNENSTLVTKIPEVTDDIIGDLIAYETNTATKKQAKKLFSTLKKTGLGKKLQGHYSSRT
jgi:hypothetical protein